MKLCFRFCNAFFVSVFYDETIVFVSVTNYFVLILVLIQKRSKTGETVLKQRMLCS